MIIPADRSSHFRLCMVAVMGMAGIQAIGGWDFGKCKKSHVDSP
jgi:hypothetical protein